MNRRHYSSERNVQILVSLLKQYGIRQVVASPGTTNVAFVGSIQQDSFFKIYSSVDERSAAYMACGLAHQSGEPVVLSCTGATASRNYLPALTEAYYRKLPILAVTSTQTEERIGHLIPQVIDRHTPPADTVRYSTHLHNTLGDPDREWYCTIEANKALIALCKDGGGPVHINLTTTYSPDFSVVELPKAKKINYLTPTDILPQITAYKVAIFIGAHATFTPKLTKLVDQFCASYNGVVMHDHTSGYHGKYGVNLSIIGAQEQVRLGASYLPDLTIHIGEVSGDYDGTCSIGREVWRVSADGEVRDTFRAITHLYDMPEELFFWHYVKERVTESRPLSYLQACRDGLNEMYHILAPQIDALPLSNIWMASQLQPLLPPNSILHLGILNSLRAWNFFQPSPNIYSSCNVGGFGIDGILSTLVGASLASPDRLCFCVVGDLAFFYDLNSLGNRHVGSNIRILLINNGTGIEFKNYNHPAARFGKDADAYMAAKGHYGHQSPTLVREYATSLGFQYLSASTKEQFTEHVVTFTNPQLVAQPMLFEVFTHEEDESRALHMVRNLIKDPHATTKQTAKRLIPKPLWELGKKILGR